MRWCSSFHAVLGSNYYRECLKFCYMLVIQKYLDNSKCIHNNHRIRGYRNQESTGNITCSLSLRGFVNVKYFFPTRFSRRFLRESFNLINRSLQGVIIRSAENRISACIQFTRHLLSRSGF